MPKVLLLKPLSLGSDETDQDDNTDTDRFNSEVRVYQIVSNGDVSQIKKLSEQVKGKSIKVGVMSTDALRQAKYSFVSATTIATRIAIVSGAIPAIAYSLSDKMIRQVDEMCDASAIFGKTHEMLEAFTSMIKDAQTKNYSPQVKKAIEYINTNIKKKLTLAEIGNVVNLSSDYISVLFSKETKENLFHYITRKKIEYAAYLYSGRGYSSQVAYEMGFSSQSYFIQCFKKQYGVTPKEYMKR